MQIENKNDDTHILYIAICNFKQNEEQLTISLDEKHKT